MLSTPIALSMAWTSASVCGMKGMAVVFLAVARRKTGGPENTPAARGGRGGGTGCGVRLVVFALEQLVPERRAYSHLAMVAWGHRGAFRG